MIKKMKQYKIILFVLATILTISSCSQRSDADTNEYDENLNNINTMTSVSLTKIISEAEITYTADTAPLEFANLDSEELFNIISKNRLIWERDRIYGATLLDLDFDGQLEFLLSYEDVTDKVAIYKFNENEFNEWYVHDNLNDMFKRISLYSDDKGNVSWVMSTQYENGEYSEDRFTLFDYTSYPPNQTTKMAVRRYKPEMIDEEYYIDGEKFIISDSQIKGFINIEPELLEWWAPSQTEDNALNYYYTKEYINFTENILNKETYKISYGYLWESYEDNKSEVYSVHGVLYPLSLLTNAYELEDYDFFKGSYQYGAAYKPVIYLYPEEETDVNVQIAFPYGGNFTCTYPDYGNSWNVTANPDGTLIDKTDGNEYYCLYWEGCAPFNWDFSSGFVVEGKHTAEFLREKLLYLGLNARECNEFIIYWLPLMNKNKYNLISFQTNAYTDKAKLEITPEPDSILRVFMTYAPLETPIDIPEQEIEPFNRTGFSVIEWGGTVHKTKLF